jgi:hypothetical protein
MAKDKVLTATEFEKMLKDAVNPITLIADIKEKLMPEEE